MKDIDAFMSDNNISDSDISRYMDLAGDVMRKHNCVYSIKGIIPELLADDGVTTLNFEIPLSIPASDIADLSIDFAYVVAENFDKLPRNVHVGFTVENECN